MLAALSVATALKRSKQASKSSAVPGGPAAKPDRAAAAADAARRIGPATVSAAGWLAAQIEEYVVVIVTYSYPA
jgi:hypothetical protein